MWRCDTAWRGQWNPVIQVLGSPPVFSSTLSPTFSMAWTRGMSVEVRDRMSTMWSSWRMLEVASLVTILQKTQLLVILEETAGTKDLDFQKTDLVKQDKEFIKEFTSKSLVEVNQAILA